jgi:hypothetical protein
LRYNVGQRVTLTNAVPIVLATLVINVCLFADALPAWSDAVVACVVAWSLTFALRKPPHEARPLRRLGNPDIWLIGLLICAVVPRSAGRLSSLGSLEVLMLLVGVAFGKGARSWALSERGFRQTCTGGVWTPFLLVVLLMVASFWGSDTDTALQYRGHSRLAGPWKNPNTFGVLMALGTVLALGHLLLGRGFGTRRGFETDESGCGRLAQQHGGGTGRRNTGPCSHPLEVGRWAWTTFFLGAAGVMSVRMLQSCSRAAWFGLALGLAYLAEEASRQAYLLPARSSDLRGRAVRWLGRNGIPATAALGAALLAGCWTFRNAESFFVQRALSVVNVNDFSWRNRAAGWEAAVLMMADRPLFGFGCRQAESACDQYYRVARVGDLTALQTNDYSLLGTALGLPALAFFLGYIGTSLSPKAKVHPPSAVLLWRTGSPMSATVCRAGAVVLLVGFWFNGGLFKLATGATFWILLELGREEAEPARVEDGGGRMEGAERK